MALLILCDPRYRNNNWCETKLKGIYDEAARRRISVKLYTDLDAFINVAAKLGKDSSVIILFNSILYLQEVSLALENLSIHPILSVTESDIVFSRAYSQVCGDVDSATKKLVEFLHEHGKRRTALLGTSENSAAGRNKEQMLARHVAKDEYSVFYDRGGLLKSFEEFFEVREQFDSVICTNDHQAIALIEYLQSKNAYDPSLYIISHGDTILSRLYGDGISTVSTGFYACGKAMVEAHVHRLKYDWASVMIRVNCNFTCRGSTSGNGKYPAPQSLARHTNQNLLTRLESMLASCDIVNFKLLYALICDYSYEHMCELCFLSHGAVKYRIRQMRLYLNCQSRKEMTNLIKSYISKESLLHLIKEREAAN